MVAFFFVLSAVFVLVSLAGIRAVQRSKCSPGERATRGKRQILAGVLITGAAVWLGRTLPEERLVDHLVALALTIGLAVIFVGYSQVERAKLDRADPPRH
jgi:hypothetical protein